jgi:UMF1 family MFS transporter
MTATDRIDRFAWISPQVRAWATYDLASSTWVAVIPTLLYAVYFRSVVAEGGPRAETWWGVTVAVALVVAGLVAPALGARTDRRGSRLAYLLAATFACCAATAAMAVVRPGQILFGALVFVVAQSGYTVAMALYDAYLSRIAVPETAGRVSAFGWAVGFLGGILAVLLCIAIVPPPSVPLATRLPPLFVAVALLFAVLAAVAALGLRQVPVPSPRGTAGLPRFSWLGPLRRPRENANLLRFLLALYLINDALATISAFTGIYLQKHYGLNLDQLLLLVLLYQVIALPATLAFGHLSDRFTLRAATFISLTIWAIAVVVMAFGRAPWMPIVVVALFATVLGSTQALLRGAYSLLVASNQSAELFGWNALVGRLSAAAGPLVYALVAAFADDQLALLSVLVFLLAGALVLRRVQFPIRIMASV